MILKNIKNGRGLNPRLLLDCFECSRRNLLRIVARNRKLALCYR